MSHVVELGLVFADQPSLEKALAEFKVQLRKNVEVKRVYATQFDNAFGVVPLVAITPCGEQLGFRKRELSKEERKQVTDQSESVKPGTRDGLVPIGDLYYGGIEQTFGTNLYKLQAAYYKNLLKKTCSTLGRVTVKETKDSMVVTLEVG